MRVLLCSVTTGTCSLGFAVSVLRLQTALLGAPGLQVTMELVPSLRDAIKRAHAGQYDALAAVESSLAFPSSFVLRGLVAPFPFVAGVHPLPTIDWERVAAKAGAEGEEARFKGTVYNVDPASAKPTTSPGYMSVPRADLRAVVLKKEAIEALSAETGDLCAAWGKDIAVDLDSQCATTGPAEFTGCVGLRAVLR